MATSEGKISGLLLDGKLEHCRVFCRVPDAEYLLFGTLLHSFVENEADRDGITQPIRKAEIEFNDPCLLKVLTKLGFTSVNRLILPERLIGSCAVPDITHLESIPDTFFTEFNVPATLLDDQYIKYAFKLVKNLRPGKVVVWCHQDAGFQLGKVYFTGIEVRKSSKEGLTIQPSDIAVFVAFGDSNLRLNQRRIYVSNYMGLKRHKYIYRVDWNDLLSLSDFTNLMEATSESDFKYELRTPGTLEIKRKQQTGSSIVGSHTKIIREAENLPHHANPAPATACAAKLDCPKAPYLTRSKVADDPDFFKQFQEEAVHDISKIISAQTHSHPLNELVSTQSEVTENKDTTNPEQNNTKEVRRSVGSFKKVKFNADKPHIPQHNSNIKSSLNIRPFSEATVWPQVHETCVNKNFSYAENLEQKDIFIKMPIQYNHGQLNVRGIQGFENSCYADSVLFSLFAFTNVFDDCLDKPIVSEDSAFAEPNLIISNILKYDIISVLRKTGFVPSTAVQKLRQAMLIYNPTFVGDLMDAEDFILTLFEKICESHKFYVFNNEAEDYVFQIHVLYEQEKKTNADLQTLLQRSFQEIDVKLYGIPLPAFIVKLPVCHGNPVFEQVVPNLIINLEPLLDDKLLNSAGTPCDYRMLLRAIICLKSQHYTSFVRTTNDKYSEWVYFDSKPGSRDPEIVHLRNFSELLENVTLVYKMCWPESDLYRYIDFALRNAYICIYEPTGVQETLL